MHASMYYVLCIMYVCLYACLYVHTWGVIALLAWSRDMHIQDLSTAMMECLCTTTETPLFFLLPRHTLSPYPLVTMCTPLPCAPALPVDAMLLCAKPLPSSSFVSDVSCRGQAPRRLLLRHQTLCFGVPCFRSHGWPSVAQKAGSTRFWSRQALGCGVSGQVCPRTYKRWRWRGWPAHTATA
jgi:hypothetical protein